MSVNLGLHLEDRHLTGRVSWRCSQHFQNRHYVCCLRQLSRSMIEACLAKAMILLNIAGLRISSFIMRMITSFKSAQGIREERALPSLPRNSKKRFPRPSSLCSCRTDLFAKRIDVVPRALGRAIPLRFLLLPPTLPVLAGRAGGQVGLPSAPYWWR